MTEMSHSVDLAGIEVGSKIVAIDLVRGHITQKTHTSFFFNESFMKHAHVIYIKWYKRSIIETIIIQEIYML